MGVSTHARCSPGEDEPGSAVDGRYNGDRNSGLSKRWIVERSRGVCLQVGGDPIA